jgi:hypothetical protein
MECKFCKETDESQLLMSSRLINGRFETIEICFKCFLFGKHKIESENGDLLSERETVEYSVSVRDSKTLNLQK